MRTPYVKQHHNVLFYQRAVPKKLRSFVGRDVWTERLGRVNEITVGTAGALAQQLAARHDAEIAALKALSEPERVNFLAGGGRVGLERTAAAIGAPFLETAARGLQPDLERDGSVLTQAELGELALLSVEAGQKAVKFRSEAAAAGKLLSKATARTAPGSALDGLCDLWEKMVQPKHPRSIERRRASLRMLSAFLGDIEPKAIARADVLRFRDHLERENVSPVMADQHLAGIKAVFEVAFINDKLQSNPAAKIKAVRLKRSHAEEKDADKQSFTGAQLRHILERAEATKFGGHRNADIMWALRLAIYHGPRISEIAQLQKADVKVLDGVKVMNLHDLPGTQQSIKNKYSVRVVPLHPACADFWDYAAAATGPRIFGTFGYDAREASWGQWIIRRFGTFLRKECNIADRRLTLHSIRHRFHDAMDDVKMFSPTQHRLVGHVEKGAHGAYGKGSGLKQLAEELAKVDPLAG